MYTFLSICLTILRIAIATTNVIQGLLIELQNAVEWLRDGQYSSTTLSTEDQSSHQSLTEPSSSDAVNTDEVAPSTQSTSSSDFPEISCTKSVFVRLDRQTIVNESENNFENLISIGTKIGHDPEVNTTEDNSSNFQENEMSKSSRNEPGASVTTSNKNVSVTEAQTEVVPLDASPNSENAVDKSEVEASNAPAVNLSSKHVDAPTFDRLERSVHSMSSIQDSQTISSSKEANYDGTLGIAAPSKKAICDPRLVSRKSESDVVEMMQWYVERYRHLGDYDTTLREKSSNNKSPAHDSSIEKSMGKQDIDLQATHSPVNASPSKKTFEGTPLKAQDDSFIPPALDQSLRLPRFGVDRSTGNVQWKTDIPIGSTLEPKELSPYETDSTAASINKQEFQCELQETSTTEEIEYKPIRDRVPTPTFPLAESSSDNEHPGDTWVKPYDECTGVSAAQREFKPVGRSKLRSKLTPVARIPTLFSTGTEEDSDPKQDSMLHFRHESPTPEETEFKSTRERRPRPTPGIVHHEQTSSSGTESGIFSEPNNLKKNFPLRGESRPPAFRSPSKSRENTQNASVRFVDQPLLTKNDRIDSIEKIEFVIKPTCGYFSPGASVYPQTASQISTPSTIDSDTPENIRYIEKASQLLAAVSSQCDKEQDYCDINSSATEFPASGSPTSAADSEDAIGLENLPQLLVESLSCTENDNSPSSECNTQTSVRFLLPESHIKKESKEFRKESKFRKPPNETSTSEEENETKVSRKRRASPGKFYKSPKKCAETTASKIRGYKFSPQRTSNEEKHKDSLSCENTSATRSLDFELGIQQISKNASILQTSIDQENPKLESEEKLSPRTIEDQVNEKAGYQQETSKAESTDDTISKTDSVSETTSSGRVGDDVAEDSEPEGTDGITPEIENDGPSADCKVDIEEKGSHSAPEGTKGLFSSLVNEVSDLQGNAFYSDSEADSTFKDNVSDNSLVKYSTDSVKSREISVTGHLELLDTNKSSQETKSPENDKLAWDQNNEKRINEKENAQSESTSNIHLLSEDEQKSNANVQLEAMDSTSNNDCSERSTSLEPSSSEESTDEKLGSDSSSKGAMDLALQLENRTSLSKSSKADRTEDKKFTKNKAESTTFSSSCKSTDKEFVRIPTREEDADNFSVSQNISHQINTVVNDSSVEIDAFDVVQRRAVEVESIKTMEVSGKSSHPITNDSRSKDPIPESEQQLEEELFRFNGERFSSNRSSVLSPVYEVSANGTVSSGSCSESETVNAICTPSASSACEKECEFLEQQSPPSELPHVTSPNYETGSLEPENVRSNHTRQMSTSKGEYVQLDTTSLDPAVQSLRNEKVTGELNSGIKTVSSLPSPSKSPDSEVDKESTMTKVAAETSDYQLSTLNTTLKKDHILKTHFSTVLEELVQRIESTSRSNSPKKTGSPLEAEDRADVSSDLQLSSAFKTNAKKVYNVRSYFDPVLKELVQRVKSTTVDNSFMSIKDENSGVPKIEVPSEISIQTYSTTDFLAVKNACILKLPNDIIQNVEEDEMKTVVETVHSDSLITGSEIKDNLDFELHIVPQPVPCEIAIKSDTEVFISNETCTDQNEIKIVDSKTPEPGLNSPDISTTKSTICPLTANSEDYDSYSRGTVAEVSKESDTEEMLSPTAKDNLPMPRTIEACAEVIIRYDSTATTLVKTAKNNFTENDAQGITNDDPSENTHLEATYKYAENTLTEVATDNSTENEVVEIEKEDPVENEFAQTTMETTENILVEATKNDLTENNEVEAWKGDPTGNNKIEKSHYSNEKTFVEVTEDNSIESNFVDVVHDCSNEDNTVDTSINLDSLVAEEVNANGNQEFSNENKAWKKKQRKSKKKRRN